jgi:hypothetical protein
MHRITGAETASSAAATLILLSAALFVRYALAVDDASPVTADRGVTVRETDTALAGAAANPGAARAPDLTGLRLVAGPLNR